MTRTLLVLAMLLSLGSSDATAQGFSLSPAPRPPMGWNSWDAYGFTINEDQFKANALILARMKRSGWDTAVIDEGWYMANPLGRNLQERQYHYDPTGRLSPDPVRFPSSLDGHGLKALADWTHAHGLKFGVHVVRGIPKAAVDADLPIAGSSFHASEAGIPSDTCPWDDANYGVADNPAGNAWYDALIGQFADWGVDFLKVDCIADHPYKGSEIRQIARAITRSGRPIVLSLSPGPTKFEHAHEVQRFAQMWRIMDDLWDAWIFPHTDPNSEFPAGIRNAFDRLAQWNGFVAPGSWPDADMLPFGSLFPHPGWGEPRSSRLSEAEVRTALTLWAIARSPLILGGNLTEETPGVAAILTNREVISLDQDDRRSRPVRELPGLSDDVRIWVSARRGARLDTAALFNIGETPMDIHLRWIQLGFAPGRLAARDLWSGEEYAASNGASLKVAPHSVVLLRLCARDAGACRRLNLVPQ